MNIRSITSAVAVLVMSTAAGSAQDWTKGSQGSTVWMVPGSQPQAQSPRNQTGDSQTRDSQFFLTRNLYANIDFGGVYQQKTTLYQSTMPSQNATFNLGIRGDIALGYDINKSLAVEFDTGTLWNSMDKVGNTSLSSIGQSFDTYTVPFLANVIYTFPTKGPWSPYVGVGAGGAAAIASFNTGGLVPTTLGDYNFVFAYQAEVGVEYKLTRNASIDVAYQFFGMSDPKWYFSEIPDHIKEGGFFTHSLAVSFTWRF
jgi:opacity protein-like surface antigen